MYFVIEVDVYIFVLGDTKYQIAIHTSNVSNAGIKVPIYLTLVGLNGTNEFCVNNTTDDAAGTDFLPGR